MKLIVASHNPVKIRSAQAGFSQMYPTKAVHAEGVDVPSGVSDQPMTEGETLTGARNRAANAKKVRPDADYWVGIEGGLARRDGRLEAFAWVAILSKDQHGEARTATFFLPPAVAALVEQGLELGDADDRVFGAENSKQKNGAVGLLTGDVMTRESLYTPAVILALIPFKRPELFGEGLKE